MTYVDSGKNDSGQHVGRIGDLIKRWQELPVKGAHLKRVLLLDSVDLDTPITEEGLLLHRYLSS
jgi:hypothetical protein